MHDLLGRKDGAAGFMVLERVPLTRWRESLPRVSEEARALRGKGWRQVSPFSKGNQLCGTLYVVSEPRYFLKFSTPLPSSLTARVPMIAPSAAP